MSAPKQAPRGWFRPRIEALEDRQVPAGLFVTGAADALPTTSSAVSLFTGVGANPGAALNSLQINPFGNLSDTRVALGDVNGDGTDDIICASGVGTAATVVIYDGASAVRGTATEISRFSAYDGFLGGVYVASADLNGDGHDEVITTPGLGGRGHLKVWDFADSGGNFLGNTPSLLTSAYVYKDYNGEVRVATLNTPSATYIVTASGAGAVGDVRLFRDADQIGSVPDLTSVDKKFLAAHLTPFAGYRGGLSVAAGDTDGDGTDELFVSKNDGDSTINVYDTTSVIKAYAAADGRVVTPLASFVAFKNYPGQVHLGAADVNGDGKVEVLATTGFSGDPHGTPVKAFTRTDSGDFTPVLAYYANPSDMGGMWLAGKDFELGKDVTSFVLLDDKTTSLPAQFGDGDGTVNGVADPGDVQVAFPNFGAYNEDVTGANLPYKDLEVSFEFEHPIASEAVVSLLYTSVNGVTSRLVLFNGPDLARSEVMSGMNVTISDRAKGYIPAGTAGQMLTGHFRADGGSLAAFVSSLPDHDGTFSVLYEDAVPQDAGTVSVAPKIRLLY